LVHHRCNDGFIR
jgi:hypothetical protein